MTITLSRIKSFVNNRFRAPRSKHPEHDALLHMLQYYHHEISDLRSKVRYLLANTPDALPPIRQTYDSFDYQWDKLNLGPALLSDASFKATVKQTISNYTQLPESWFSGKKIIDIGCGQGRFSYGFSLLKANITAIDQSQHAVENTQKALLEQAPDAVVKQHDLLTPLPFGRDFDLVWSYGVLHHTGNTHLAFNHIHGLVKPNGYLFLMLYGEPQLGNIPSFQEQAEYARLRQLTKNLSFEEKIEVLLNEKPKEHLHGWFDAISPAINDTYSLEEIKSWLITAGFGEIQVTSSSTNHHVIAKKIA